MTKAEAINKWIIPAIRNTWNDKKCEEIIKAIEQQPCSDAISRQTVKEQMIKYGFHALDMTVTEFVEGLPPVIPQPKTGHWCRKHSWEIYFTCSECGTTNAGGTKYNYCPSCGARMREVEE